MNTYLPDTTYDALVAALHKLLGYPTGWPAIRNIENEIKIILGDTGNIWPVSILPDVIHNGLLTEVVALERS